MPTVYLATRRMHAGAGPGDSDAGMAGGRAAASMLRWSSGVGSRRRLGQNRANSAG